MFSLISGLWHYLFSPQNFHVLIIGIDSAGKTTLLENIKRNYGAGGLPSDKITPTIGMNLAKIRYDGAQVIFWDLGGQSKMRAMWEKYYMEANAVIYVVDSANEARIEEARFAFDNMLEDPSLSQTPVLIVANKQDMEVLCLSLGPLLLSGSVFNTCLFTFCFIYNFQGAFSPNELAASTFRVSCDRLGVVLSSGCGYGSHRNIFGVSAVTSAGLDDCLATVVRECRLNAHHHS
mmetsp:Transcript_1343/g.2400  ORF Transcript_1343/g.2400 Transcript_1343/m.2400 type:complete len:234 (-) Transcript_1343:1508-2209(-)